MSSIPGNHIHQDLRRLCIASDEKTLAKELGTLVPRTESVARQAITLIQSNAKFINKDDVPYLLGLQAKLIQYNSLSDLSHLDILITGICRKQGISDKSQAELLTTLEKSSPEKIGNLSTMLAYASTEDKALYQKLQTSSPQQLRQALSLIPDKAKLKEMIEIFWACSSVASDVIETAKPLLLDIEDPARMTDMLRALEGIDLNKLETLMPVLKTTWFDIDKIELLIALNSTVINPNTLEKAIPYLQDTWGRNYKINIIRALEGIDPNTLEKAGLLLLEALRDGAGSRMLRALKGVDPNTLEKAGPLLTHWVDRNIDIIESLKDVDPNTLGKAIPLLTKVIPRSEWVGLIKAFRGLTLESFDKMSSSIPDITNVYAWIRLAQIVRYLAPKDRDQCIDTLCSKTVLKKDNTPIEYVNWLLQKMPDIVESTHAYLKNQLENEPDINKAQELAQNIWNPREKFLLFDEHPLAQAALNVLIATESKNNPKNPYAIYGKLKEMRNKPPIAFQTPPQEVAQRQLHLDPLTCQKRAQEKKLITFANLKSVEPKAPTLYFEALETRLNALTPTERQAAEKEIAAMTASTFNLLKANFSQPFLINLLKIKGEKKEEVPPVNALFFAIMHYLSKLSDVVEPEKLLSPREEALLKMSASIQNCSVGQSEGISLAYEYLPVEYRYGADVAEGNATPEKKATAYLDTLVQSQLENLLSDDNSMMKEMVGTVGPVDQLAHQSRYLKNLIGPSIGLQHRLTFDPYTFTLFDPLIQRDLPQTLEIFYRHFTPELLVKALLQNVNRTLEEDTKESRALYNNLYEWLGDSEGWELSDKDKPILTEVGAMNLLIKADYLK